MTKHYPRIGMRPIASSIREWWSLQPRTWRRGLVMSYPHYLHLYEQLRPDVSVYYNIDDYALYWPRRRPDPRSPSSMRRFVRPMSRSACRGCEPKSFGGSSPTQPSEFTTCRTGLRRRFWPSNRSSARRGPPADLAHLPGPYLGYIGSLEDRVDWELMDRISQTFPHASIIVVGRVRPGQQALVERLQRFMSPPNVHTLGWRAQEEIAAYYQAFEFTLIPYRMDHAFNRACNPTKIMDSMGSGRPIVATAIPECRLHTERFDVADSADAFVDAVRRILGQQSDDGRARRFATPMHWPIRATASASESSI